MNKYVLLSFVILAVSCTASKNKGQKVEYIGSNDHMVIKKYVNDTIQSAVTYALDTQVKKGEATYYRNGHMVKRVNWDDNVLVGSHIEYENGNPSIFICHDSYGDTIFLRMFNGRHINFDSGQILPHGVLQKQDINKDSTVNYVGFIVKPPYTKIGINNFIVNIDDRDTIYPFKSSVDYDWVHTYYFKIKRSGNYLQYRVVSIIDSLRDINKKIIATDTTLFSVHW